MQKTNSHGNLPRSPQVDKQRHEWHGTAWHGTGTREGLPSLFFESIIFRNQNNIFLINL